MEIESAKCDCCGLKEDCTRDYIAQIKLNFEGKWLCGLCAEAVRDEIGKASKGVGEALKAHMSFCRQFKSNPAGGLADGMRQMLRRRSVDLAGYGGSNPGGGDGGGGAHGMRQKFRRRSVEFAGYGGSTSGGGGGGGGDGGGTVRGGPKKYSQVGDGSSISMF
ncbi:hypothetical protein QJS04_geneDACA013044 [Acorus gramineus]|uniref:Uncharacterized protein n=1 Tax=Acorus gramineus TaxID=55184 RepID=A0AAV9B3M3_ACOGR|nr:hypothetical protein QJS04_geneDACA013044 [Acorus gramineus]